MAVMRTTLVAVSSVMVMLAFSNPVLAAKSTVTVTKATDDGEGVDVRGKVESPKAACIKNRVVKVYHDVDPKGPSSQDFLLGDTLTNDKGKWRLSTTFFPDRVYAKVQKKSLKKGACDKATSKSIPVDVTTPQ